MKKLLLFLLLYPVSLTYAQITPTACNSATPIPLTSNYCSANGAYTLVNGFAYFQFLATATDVAISVTAASTAAPGLTATISLFSDCTGTELVGTGITTSNSTTFYKGGLIVGNVYYIEISSITELTGSFSLCLNNYTPAVKAGQDCISALFLCSTQTVSQQDVVGAGLYNNEAKGTCLDAGGEATESNSVWYKWKAANNGTLVFTITPNNVKDDIDWVLYDLDTTGDCGNVNAANAIRCKAGYGVNNSSCPQDTIYYKSGLDFKETDVSEPQGCGQGQNGKLKFITMQQGHVYGLLVNNFSSGANGFTLAFTDQHGNQGTGTFVSPKAAVDYSEQNDCTVNQAFTFTSTSMNYDTLKWSFGDGASIASAIGPGPYVINYTTPGVKVVSLTAVSREGCTDIVSKKVTVGIKPAPPPIQINSNTFCIADTVKLTTSPGNNYTYQWTGPNNFQSDSSTAVIQVTGNEISGLYKLTITAFGCSSDADSISVGQPTSSPIAAFHTSPATIRVTYGPVTVQFNNDSRNADNYYWDFGDGSFSKEANPSHTYRYKGNYSVKLTAYKGNSCSISATQSNLVEISDENYIFIPNAFTPNGDSINDLFIPVITNITSYHLQIFNRWGQPLFEATDITNYWDGKFKGQPLPSATYYYVIKAKSSDGSNILRSGFIALIK
ncbi:gliding motility-associated C-terminal domain-containing protein [Mucilaginibacter sp.]